MRHIYSPYGAVEVRYGCHKEDAGGTEACGGNDMMGAPECWREETLDLFVPPVSPSHPLGRQRFGTCCSTWRPQEAAAAGVGRACAKMLTSTQIRCLWKI